MLFFWGQYLTALTCSAPPLIVEPKGEGKTTLSRHLPKGLPPEHLKKSRLEIIGHTEIAGNGPGSVLACLFLYFFVFVNNNSHPNTKVMIIKSLNGILVPQCIKSSPHSRIWEKWANEQWHNIRCLLKCLGVVQKMSKHLLCLEFIGRKRRVPKIIKFWKLEFG